MKVSGVDLHSLRAEPSKLHVAQSCLDHLSSSGGWEGETWTAPTALGNGCDLRAHIGTEQARSLLAGHHVMVVGDLAARLWYAALLYLLNGTHAPEEVAVGYPQHIGSCWSPDSMRRGGYEFAGWGHIKKGSPCFLRWYGPNAGTLYNLTLKHPAGSKAWWGRGTSRDVMTLLLREKLFYSTWHGHATTVSYLWKGVIRTSGSYKSQHARHVATVASRIGRAPTLIVVAMGAYDSQWQNVAEVSKRLAGLFEGLVDRWPAREPSSPLLLYNGPSSCAPGKRYSVVMGQKTRHNTFHSMPNASALIPHARTAAANHSVLYLDTSGPQMSVPELRNSPCHYDLPIGRTAEALVQIALRGVAATAKR